MISILTLAVGSANTAAPRNLDVARLAPNQMKLKDCRIIVKRKLQALAHWLGRVHSNLLSWTPLRSILLEIFISS